MDNNHIVLLGIYDLRMRDRLIKLLISFLKRNKQFILLIYFFKLKTFFTYPGTMFIDLVTSYQTELALKYGKILDAPTDAVCILSQKWRIEVIESDILGRYDSLKVLSQFESNGTGNDPFLIEKFPSLIEKLREYGL